MYEINAINRFQSSVGFANHFILQRRVKGEMIMLLSLRDACHTLHFPFSLPKCIKLRLSVPFESWLCS